jgi:hypothetical protein
LSRRSPPWRGEHFVGHGRSTAGLGVGKTNERLNIATLPRSDGVHVNHHELQAQPKPILDEVEILQRTNNVVILVRMHNQKRTRPIVGTSEGIQKDILTNQQLRHIPGVDLDQVLDTITGKVIVHRDLDILPNESALAQKSGILYATCE